MTEESFASHYPIFGYAQDKHLSCGQLLANFEQRIVSLKTGEPLPAKSIGEVYIRSPTLMLGYFNRADATSDSIDNEVNADHKMFLSKQILFSSQCILTLARRFKFAGLLKDRRCRLV